jgi:DNA-binding CsgD family transcriptional regulator
MVTAALSVQLGRHYVGGPVFVTAWIALFALGWRVGRKRAFLGAAGFVLVLIGASAFVPKDAPAEDVVAAARHAAASPQAFTAANLADAMKRRMEPTGPQLSPREREVLVLLADGLGVAQISKRLYISESTTKTHISKLYEKLEASNRTQAVMAAVRLGLLTPQPAAG